MSKMAAMAINSKNSRTRRPMILKLDMLQSTGSLYGLNELIISEKLELARHRIRNIREN